MDAGGVGVSREVAGSEGVTTSRVMVERRPEEADTKPSPEVSTEVLLGTNGVKGEAPGTEDDNLGRRAAADEVFDAGEIVTEQLDGEAAGVEVDGRLVVVETAAESGGGFDSDRDEDGEEEVGGDEADGVIDGPCVGAEECGMGGEPDATNAAYEKVRSAAVPTPIGSEALDEWEEVHVDIPRASSASSSCANPLSAGSS
ncbi:unnamed protein product [Tilletia controversa]|nr:unnamed protein product [Tilletia controversa]